MEDKIESFLNDLSVEKNYSEATIKNILNGKR